ncbi:PRC-barrel domain-containing protein [Pseudoroseicyclus sp. H15]
MKITTRSLLLTTALTIPAGGAVMAQDADAEVCADLMSMIEADDGTMSDDDANQMMAAIEAGDIESCQLYLVQFEDDAAAMDTAEGDVEAVADESVSEDAVAVDSERTTVRLQDEAVIEGTVYLEQTPPTVDIQGGDAQVDVTETAPNVTVTEGQASIVVRQAAPNITVDMPQPTIRIEQPAPEIIITMPEPGVDVATTEPRVEVRQAEPTITVTQARPRVDLELQRADDEENSPGVQVADRNTGDTYEMGAESEPREMSDAQVNMSASQPTVTFMASEEGANVDIQRTQPTVSYESAQPNVQFTSNGEPQIDFVQSGEATVTFADADGNAMDAESGDDDTAVTAMGEETDTEAMGEDADMEEMEPADEDTSEQIEQNAEEVGNDIEAAADEAGDEIEEAGADVAAAADEATDEVGQELDEAGNEIEGEMAEADAEMGANGDLTATADDDMMEESMGPDVAMDGYTRAGIGEIQADTLIGRTLYGINDEAIGDIGDLVLGSDGSIESVIVEVGGFLGLGETNVAVPFDTVTILSSDAGDDVRVYADYTEDELEAMESVD